MGRAGDERHLALSWVCMALMFCIALATDSPPVCVTMRKTGCLRALLCLFVTWLIFLPDEVLEPRAGVRYVRSAWVLKHVLAPASCSVGTFVSPPPLRVVYVLSRSLSACLPACLLDGRDESPYAR